MSDFCSQVGNDGNYHIVLIGLWVIGVLLDDNLSAAHLYLLVTSCAINFYQFWFYALFTLMYAMRVAFLLVTRSTRFAGKSLTPKTFAKSSRRFQMLWMIAIGLIVSIIEVFPATTSFLATHGSSELYSCIPKHTLFTTVYFGSDLLLFLGAALTYTRIRNISEWFSLGYGAGTLIGLLFYGYSLLLWTIHEPIRV